MEKVTVLMSTYNGEKFIREQIDSILNQKDVLVDLVIRDDGSNDRTVEIISKYASKNRNISYYVGKNLKPAKSFLELMIKQIDCDYFALADQDYIWDPDKIKSAINKICNTDNTKPVMYFSNLRIVDQDNVFYRNSHSKPKMTLKYNALTEDTATGCTIVYNRKASELLREHIPVTFSMHDSWLYLICIFLGEVVYDFKPHINYRQHGNNVVGTYLEKKSLRLYFSRIKRLFNRDLQPRYNNAVNFLEQFEKLLNKEDVKYIKMITNYKKSLKNRFHLILNRNVCASSLSRDLRYRALILFGIV